MVSITIEATENSAVTNAHNRSLVSNENEAIEKLLQCGSQEDISNQEFDL
jgi:hypothetical protein